MDANSRQHDSPTFFTKRVFQQDQAMAQARAAYFKIYIRGVIMVAITILSIFSIFWGALWRIPAYALPGWIDFDGGELGQIVAQDLMAADMSVVSWEMVPASEFPNGIDGVAEKIRDNRAWVAVIINQGATARLESSISNPNASYKGEEAITVYGIEARNERAYRELILPTISHLMASVKLDVATRYATKLSTNSASNVTSILAISPQTIVNPVSYTLINLVPFSQPVAAAAISTGLIFVLIMSFFVVNIANGAREASKMNKLLKFRSLIALRLGSSFISYFFLSLIYSLLNLAFKLDLAHVYGHAGFMVFWMFSWTYMLAVGLALESLITLLKQYLQYFLILWIVVNISVVLFPLEVLPKVFHYGYAAPFYNVAEAVRTIVFGTKNSLGLNFGVLIAWVLISCLSLIGIQWFVRWQDAKLILEAEKKAREAPGEKQGA
ncbi:hypothetical protein GALMADRAFT_1156271 [Galerina marginata CBS 339.88]|uniref:DUF3533 domain-containing protein n=1 Tax=Galerina marginata (strain CBS 339.88) TaxID=685588 RepID=A0A067SFL0_GALM3|nr:hypothetical protein GALMADRAFT_1156271 [Galerina marginata CBS 339.88]